MHVEEIKKGIKDSWAVGIGLIPLGLAFGLLMVQTGFAWWWTPIFSIVVYAGSMEFLAIPMVLNNTSVAASIITGFMVNFRHMFYGLTFPRHRINSGPGKSTPLTRLPMSPMQSSRPCRGICNLQDRAS